MNTIESTTYRPPKKIRRISQHDARETSIPPPSPAPSTSSTAATGYIQGMSLIINNTDSSDFSGRISAQNVTESTEIPGAIAIPIQVRYHFGFDSYTPSFPSLFSRLVGKIQ